MILPWLVLSFNLLSLSLYVIDKLLSSRSSRRISEKSLLASALIAPFGSLVGMMVFRHKTRKVLFWAVVAVSLSLQLFALVKYSDNQTAWIVFVVIASLCLACIIYVEFTRLIKNVPNKPQI